MSKDVPYPKKVVFVRHAESEGNVLTRDEQRRFPVGTNRYNLSPHGREQAHITGEWMRKHFPNPDRVIYSYYARTNETARILYPNLSLREDALLAERDRGIWTNTSEAEVMKFLPSEIDRRDQQGSYHYRPIGGENLPDVERRVREFRRSIRSNYSGKTIVVVGHSQWILLWQKIVHGWSIEETMRRYEAQDWAENASVTIYHNAWQPLTDTYVLEHDHEYGYVVPWKENGKENT